MNARPYGFDAFRTLAIALLLALAAVPAVAQIERSASPSQKIMQQYQQLAAEKTALQAQVAQMKKDLDGATMALGAMKKERDALALKLKAGAGAGVAATAQLTAAKESAERNLEQNKQKMSELIARFRETGNNLRQVEVDREKLTKDLDERNGAYDKCAEDNLQLYEINSDLLNRYDHVGLFTKVSAGEPFTRITRTRIDNLVVEYRTRAEELRAKKRAP
jgi:chromosome segregation ATPase